MFRVCKTALLNQDRRINTSLEVNLRILQQAADGTLTLTVMVFEGHKTAAASCWEVEEFETSLHESS